MAIGSAPTAEAGWRIGPTTPPLLLHLLTTSRRNEPTRTPRAYGWAVGIGWESEGWAWAGHGQGMGRAWTGGARAGHGQGMGRAWAGYGWLKREECGDLCTAASRESSAGTLSGRPGHRLSRSPRRPCLRSRRFYCRAAVDTISSLLQKGPRQGILGRLSALSAGGPGGGGWGRGAGVGGAGSSGSPSSAGSGTRDVGLDAIPLPRAR